SANPLSRAWGRGAADLALKKRELDPRTTPAHHSPQERPSAVDPPRETRPSDRRAAAPSPDPAGRRRPDQSEHRPLLLHRVDAERHAPRARRRPTGVRRPPRGRARQDGEPPRRDRGARVVPAAARSPPGGGRPRSPADRARARRAPGGGQGPPRGGVRG